MGKYEPLRLWIKENGTDKFTLIYVQIEENSGLTKEVRLELISVTI